MGYEHLVTDQQQRCSGQRKAVLVPSPQIPIPLAFGISPCLFTLVLPTPPPSSLGTWDLEFTPWSGSISMGGEEGVRRANFSWSPSQLLGSRAELGRSLGEACNQHAHHPPCSECFPPVCQAVT